MSEFPVEIDFTTLMEYMHQYNNQVESSKTEYQLEIQRLREELTLTKQELELVEKTQNERAERQIARLARQCTRQEQLLKRGNISLENHMETEEIKLREHSIFKLTQENASLFMKIGQIRKEKDMEINRLKQELSRFQQAAVESPTVKDIPAEFEVVEPEETKAPIEEDYTVADLKPSGEISSMVSNDLAARSATPMPVKNWSAISTPDVNPAARPSSVPAKTRNSPSEQKQKRQSLGNQTNTSRNFNVDGEPNYLYQEVVRNKLKRKEMHGVDCFCCKDYYRLTEGVKPLTELGQSKDSSRINQSSRHRVWSKKPDTPPGFWDVGFPNTQQLAEQKQLANKR